MARMLIYQYSTCKFLARMLAIPAVVAFLLALIIWLDLPQAIYRYFKFCKRLKPIPRPPNLSYHWLLGHIPAVYKQDEKLYLDFVEEVNKPVNRDKHITVYWYGPISLVNITHSKVLMKLFKEPKSTDFYSLLLPWLGEGLLISKGDKWFRNRRLLTPAFHYEILKGHVPVYNSCVSVLLDKWSMSALQGESVKLFNTLSLMSLDIIMQCAFSFKSGCQATEHPYTSACSNLVNLCTERMMNPFYMFDWFYWFTPHGRKTRRLCNLVHKHAGKVISERKLDLKKCVPEASEENVGKTRKYLDFLDILLVAKDDDDKGMTDLEIRNEVDTFMFEGHDTTTSGMSWTLYCLAKYPEHQDKVREEVRNVLMGRECLEYDDLKELKYTTWCIKEAMRLYPPVFNYFRTVSKDIEFHNLMIPEGATVNIDVFTLHRNASIWEDPTKYDPLRFQPDSMEKHGPYDYIPFSAGHRNCIGQNFAMNEMRVVVGTILKQFLLKVDETHLVKISPKVVLRAENDIKIYLQAIGTEN